MNNCHWNRANIISHIHSDIHHLEHNLHVRLFIRLRRAMAEMEMSDLENGKIIIVIIVTFKHNSIFSPSSDEHNQEECLTHCAMSRSRSFIPGENREKKTKPKTKGKTSDAQVLCVCSALVGFSSATNYEGVRNACLWSRAITARQKKELEREFVEPIVCVDEVVFFFCLSRFIRFRSDVHFSASDRFITRSVCNEFRIFTFHLIECDRIQHRTEHDRPTPNARVSKGNGFSCE